MVHFSVQMSLVTNLNGSPTRQFEQKVALTHPVGRSTIPENEVSFQAADEREFGGGLVHLTRQAVTFELDSRAAALRTSEVLSHFRISSGGRVLYFGRAVVASVVSTGGAFLCEAKLDQLGPDTAYFLPPPGRGGNLEAAYNDFFQAWQNHYRISEEFKVLVADVQSYLTGVRHWLEAMEFGLKDAGDKLEREHAILDAVAPRIIAAFNGRHERFEEIIDALPPEARGVHEDFVRRHWHPLFLGSPFGHRCHRKPIGYAGDYEMMNMIHRNQPEGRSLFEKLIHRLLVSQWPAKSVRNRVAHVEENIRNETARVARAGRTARILNIGCGPAKEVQDFLQATPLSNQAEFTLIDFNDETLAHAGGKLVEAKRQFCRQTQVRTQQISVYELLKRTQRRSADAEKFDLIYCTGLFDYLAPDTCRALLELWDDSLSPGGLVLIANMDDTRPFRYFIEFILDWQLIYRDRREILSLVPERCRGTTRVVAEPTSVNLFLHIRRPV